MIHPVLMRQLWASIEAMQTTTLDSLDDRTLVEQLMGVVGRKQALNDRDKQDIDRYLRAKLPLVRDIADARMNDCRKK